MLKGEAADIEYYNNKCNSKGDVRGTYEQFSNEDCRKKAIEWVRSNACHKGIPKVSQS